jgi:cytochrome c oxidase subunit 2
MKSRNIRTRFLAAAVTLASLLPIASLSRAQSPQVVEITAKRFAFEPNQVTLKKGQTVTLRINSQDVTHGFFLKPLKIDEVIEPGKTAEVTVTPQAPGTYTLICDHFCGANHGNMKMTVVVTD